MKKFILSLALILGASLTTMSADVTRNGNEFVAQASTSKAGKATETKYTYRDTDGKSYTIWLSVNGRAYINRTSKAGNEYKKYLGEEISRQICAEMGIEYKDLKK